MTGGLQSIDTSLFHFINSSLGNPVFDRLMPFLSDSPCFTLFFLALGIYLAWKGGARGRVCVLMFLISLLLGSLLVCDPIKNVIGRPRPFQSLSDVVLRVGKGGSYSMPSSHAFNWFCTTMVFLVYYRPSAWILLPLAALVSFSRVYNGVHFPSDVLAGSVLGAGCAAGLMGLVDGLWQSLGPGLFPIWKKQLPSLLNPTPSPTAEVPAANAWVRDSQWLRLGYLLTAALLLIRLIYLASGRIELSEDEAYQWLWSKHLALSYYSKPLLIACAQFLGTHLWGDSALGVRFLSPVITAILSILVLNFVGRESGGRTAFFLLLAIDAAPLLALGSIVMTVDPLSVMFWTAAMISGWRAAGPTGTTRQWLWTGLWMGLGFLSKYTNLVQLLCWSVFFLLWPTARAHLRRAGPWLALLILAVCSLPVVIWNAQHHWITVAHVASDGQLGEPWRRIFTWEFLMTEAGALNPIFFAGAVWAAIGFWISGRRDPLQLYLFSMGAPLFLIYFALSFHSRVEANWIAPSVVPLFCLMAIYWAARWKNHAAVLRPLMALGLGAGFFTIVLAHNPQLVDKLIHRRLPASAMGPLRRVRGWSEMAATVGAAFKEIEARDGPAFIICDHYGFTSQISFYLPEAKRLVTTDPMVYYLATQKPDNQFYFWPNYLNRGGQSALFVREIELPRLKPHWFSLWWSGRSDLYVEEAQPKRPMPAELSYEFESITDLGVRDIVADGQVVRRIQIFECRNLKRL